MAKGLTAARVQKVQVLGLCRFSFPAGLNAFQTRDASEAARQARLYDPARLAYRMIWFEHILLPAIRAQSEPDFTLMLLLGDDFPEPFRARIEALVGGLRQIVLEYHPGQDHRPLYRRLFMARTNPRALAVAQFRLDDDDAVASDFVRRLRQDFIQGGDVFQRQGALALEYARGMVVTDKGGRVSWLPRLGRLISAGLAVCLPPSAERCVMDYPHQKVWMRMPVLTQTDTLMFLRGAHGGNDSGSALRGMRPFVLADDAVTERLLRRFAVDRAGFERSIAAFHAQADRPV